LILTGARRGRNCLVVVGVPAEAGRRRFDPCRGNPL